MIELNAAAKAGHGGGFWSRFHTGVKWCAIGAASGIAIYHYGGASQSLSRDDLLAGLASGHQTILQDPEQSLDASFGLRLMRGSPLDAQLR
jgi:hypothetical protein